MSCALCDLVRDPHGLGTAAYGRSVYEDEVAKVLVDGAPARRGQAWVIPKAHVRDVSDLDERTGKHLLELGRRAALSLGIAASVAEVQLSIEDDGTGDDRHVRVRVELAPRAR